MDSRTFADSSSGRMAGGVGEASNLLNSAPYQLARSLTNPQRLTAGARLALVTLLPGKPGYHQAAGALPVPRRGGRNNRYFPVRKRQRTGKDGSPPKKKKPRRK